MIDLSAREERHRIFKEKLYKFANLPRLEFKAKIQVFKEENPDFVNDKKIDPELSRYKMSKFYKEFFGE